MKLSRIFVATLKLDPRPAYQVSQLANVDPNWLSKAVIGAIQLDSSDKKIRRVAEILGLSESEIFEEEKDQNEG